jgi:hypothetical protein
MSEIIERPEIVEDHHLEYLDWLRETGITNMFGAGAYLREEYGFERDEASEVLKYWMQTFGERHKA